MTTARHLRLGKGLAAVNGASDRLFGSGHKRVSLKAADGVTTAVFRRRRKGPGRDPVVDTIWT